MKTTTLFRTVAGSALAAAILVLSPSFSDPAISAEAKDTAQSTISDSAKGDMKTKSESVGEYVDDAAITTAVKGSFLTQKGLDSLDISVETTDGVVVLTGKVDSDAQIGLAEQVAKEVKGVKNVVNKLTLKK